MSPQLDAPVLDAVIRVDRLPGEGRDVEVTASDDQRHALADVLGITAVEALTARLHASPFRGGIRVTGQLRATIVQPCVVTLEPVVQAIDELIERVFMPAGEVRPSARQQPDVFVDPEADDPPDSFDGREADLSGLLVETLALAIDPYPRAPGVDAGPLVIGEEDDEDSPFAALKRLQERDGDA